MSTFTAFTTLLGKENASALGEALESLDPAPVGIGVFEIEDKSNTWEVGGYYTKKPNEIELTLLSFAYGAKPFTFSDVPDQDWVSHVQRNLPPVEAGRFFLFGNHDAHKVPKSSIGLLIEASMAFGTGQHGTTKGCLLVLNDLIAEGVSPKKIIDIGCGTAVLAMAAAKIWDETIIASDIDPTAVAVTKINLISNKLEQKVSCIQSKGFSHPSISEEGPYDLIFANILKGPLIDMVPEFSEHCAFGGTIILSGLLNEQYDEVLRAYIRAGFKLIQKKSLGEWMTLRMQREIK
ncbi:MAG: 50S ribosomal protein L11 methyltransferase [Rhodobacteraceae bacterium]|nr:50S ribosomal protein L11 methyltransferase [Paracoccaceae bacterium]MDG1299353.1 50S ribosomal protein L11 methyltransferase [Paracoccaceae bacterium]MDG2373867.1 50S ribosomal protein L11 methyltransferase [Paracoccaceae bacterium]